MQHILERKNRENLLELEKHVSRLMGSVSLEESRFKWTYTKTHDNRISAAVKSQEKKVKVSLLGDGVIRQVTQGRNEIQDDIRTSHQQYQMLENKDTILSMF